MFLRDVDDGVDIESVVAEVALLYFKSSLMVLVTVIWQLYFMDHMQVSHWISYVQCEVIDLSVMQVEGSGIYGNF